MRDQSPYRALPEFYDAVMAHVDYRGWAAYLQRLWSREKLAPRSVLELAAGTCPMHRIGAYPTGAQIVYTDLSVPMLRAASFAAGAPPGTEPAPQLRLGCNAMALPFTDSAFDLVIMIYDSFNYLMDKKGAMACLKEVHRVLQPGGIFIFDVTTRTNSLRHFTDFLDIEELPKATLIRRSTFDEEARLQQNAFTIFVEEGDGRFRREDEVHQQRVFDLKEIGEWAAAAGFEEKGRLAGFSMRPGGEGSERIHYVLAR
jgi:ubiquinone/menaquinone biosynthesis C-methylase UbiE